MDTANNKPVITNPTSYVLISDTWAGPITNGTSYLFSYNSDHLISTIEWIQWSNGSTLNGDTVYYHYQYANGLCDKVIMNHNGETAYSTYEYNNKGLAIKVVLYNGNLNQRTDLYTYDSANNLIKITDSTQQLNYVYEFSYDGNGSLTSMNTIQSQWQSQISRYEWNNFDDKVNYIKAVNGLPPSSVSLSDDYMYSSLNSPHNYTSENYYAFVNVGQPFGNPYSFSKSYQYNDEGLPTTLQSGPWTVTLVYEKYK